MVIVDGGFYLSIRGACSLLYFCLFGSHIHGNKGAIEGLPRIKDKPHLCGLPQGGYI